MVFITMQRLAETHKKLGLPFNTRLYSLKRVYFLIAKIYEDSRTGEWQGKIHCRRGILKKSINH